jgi:hypothetical protein
MRNYAGLSDVDSQKGLNALCAMIQEVVAN